MPPETPDQQAWEKQCGVQYVLCPVTPQTCCPNGYACCGGPNGAPMLECTAGYCEFWGSDDSSGGDMAKKPKLVAQKPISQ
jgi:hypothetical protein